MGIWLTWPKTTPARMDNARFIVHADDVEIDGHHPSTVQCLNCIAKLAGCLFKNVATCSSTNFSSSDEGIF
eukprot:9179897-Pyramimonas_sp.AAC.1